VNAVFQGGHGSSGAESTAGREVDETDRRQPNRLLDREELP
jgi:hypothetical protein